MSTAAIIIGATPRNRGNIVSTAPRNVPRRLPNEFYPTPPEATRALLSAERFEGSIWEPACGEGAIANVLTDAGHKVVATDLVEYGFGISGIDFLKELRPRAKHIVTNPPYGSGLADAFAEKALGFAAQTGGGRRSHRRGSTPSTISSAGPRIAMGQRRRISPSTATSGRSGPQTIEAPRPSGGCRLRSSAPVSLLATPTRKGEPHET
jgi:hypothetical protein